VLLKLGVLLEDVQPHRQLQRRTQLEVVGDAVVVLQQVQRLWDGHVPALARLLAASKAGQGRGGGGGDSVGGEEARRRRREGGNVR
jgi:hypothetical protein